MREIKFRAKAINRVKGRQYRTKYKNGDWVYGLLEKHKNDYHCAEMINENEVSGIDVDEETLGQFTGFYDKNGKEIYNGDIVKFLDSEYTVVFENGTFGLGTYKEIDYDKIEKEVEETTDNDYTGVYCDNFISLWTIYWNFNCEDDVITQIEVIGNIYENKGEFI